MSISKTGQHNGDLSICLSICQVSVFTGLIQESRDKRNRSYSVFHCHLRKVPLKLLIKPHPDLLFGVRDYLWFGVSLDPRAVHTAGPFLLWADEWRFTFLLPPSSSSSPTGLITPKHSFLSLLCGWQACTKRKTSKSTNKGIYTQSRNGSTLLAIGRDRCSIGRTSLSLIDTSVFSTWGGMRSRWNLFSLFRHPLL